MINNLVAKNKFIQTIMNNKVLEKYQTSFVRKSLPSPWYEVANILIKYITLEGRFKIVISYNFSLFNHFIFSYSTKVNFPFFILNILAILVDKFKRNRSQVPLHDIIIKLVHDQALLN